MYADSHFTKSEQWNFSVLMYADFYLAESEYMQFPI